MSKNDWLSPSVVSLVVGPILKLCIVFKFGSCRVILQPIPAVLIKPTVHDLDLALALIEAAFLELGLNPLLALLRHAHVIRAVKLEIVPFVVLSNVLSGILGTRLIVVLL